MITICTGWKTRHPEVVLKPEDGQNQGVSHGMCPECQREMMAQFEDPAYKVYKDSVSDPRD